MSSIPNPIVGYTGIIVDSDPPSKALRVISYDVNGLPINKLAGHSYMQGWGCGNGSAVPVGGSSIFHIRNSQSSAKSMYVKSIRLDIVTMTKSNPPQMVSLDLVRTSGANMTGGSSTSPNNCGRKDTSSPDPSFSDFRASNNMAPLSTAGVTFGQSLGLFNHECDVSRVERLYLFDEYNRPIVIKPGEGLAIRVLDTINATMSWGITGDVVWDEY